MVKILYYIMIYVLFEGWVVVEVDFWEGVIELLGLFVVDDVLSCYVGVVVNNSYFFMCL